VGRLDQATAEDDLVVSRLLEGGPCFGRGEGWLVGGPVGGNGQLGDDQKRREQKSLRMEGSRFKSKSPMCVCYLGLLMGLGEEMSNLDVIKLPGVDRVCVCLSVCGFV